MPRYEAFATRWDDSHVVDELIPTKNLEFSLPLSEHGECSFTATVEPGWSSWRSSLTKDVSGILVTRDGQPVWDGWLTDDDEVGDRTFQFRAHEWGFFFTRCLAVPHVYTNQNDCLIFRDMIDRAQALVGKNVGVQTGSALGASFSDRTINAWDRSFVETLLREVSNAEGGPEWYFGSTGSIDNPVRQLYLGDRLGNIEASTFLEYVEDTAPVVGPEGIPTVGLLGDLFPGDAPIVPTRRAGGNVIAKARHRAGDSVTEAIAVNDAPEGAQLSSTATSSLVTRGWPSLTSVQTYSGVAKAATLARHARADLKAAEGFATGYSLVTLDDDPDWTQCPRGSSVMVSIDTDIYAGPRPLQFTSRVYNQTVRVPDTGRAQIEWSVATVQEF